MENVIGILKTCQQVSIAFLILFFVITVVLFFVFDIKTIFSIRTGRAKNKTVKEMQKANATTGRLRVGGKTLTSQLDKNDRDKSKKLTGSLKKSSPKTADITAPAAPAAAEASQTEVLTQPPAASEYVPDSEPTSQLSSAGVKTNITAKTEAPVQRSAAVNFTVIKKIVIINTDEIIG